MTSKLSTVSNYTYAASLLSETTQIQYSNSAVRGGEEDEGSSQPGIHISYQPRQNSSSTQNVDQRGFPPGSYCQRDRVVARI
jgi:hypothetical protein